MPSHCGLFVRYLTYRTDRTCLTYLTLPTWPTGTYLFPPPIFHASYLAVRPDLTVLPLGPSLVPPVNAAWNPTPGKGSSRAAANETTS